MCSRGDLGDPWGALGSLVDPWGLGGTSGSLGAWDGSGPIASLGDHGGVPGHVLGFLGRPWGVLGQILGRSEASLGVTISATICFIMYATVLVNVASRRSLWFV